MTRTEQHSIPSLTSSEQERGLQALAILEQLDQKLLPRRSGGSVAPSWELLDQAREGRMAELMREQ